MILLKVFVPVTHDGFWIFKFVCPGNAFSVSHNRLLLLKNATVNRNLGFDDVCKEKQVFVAYNNVYKKFYVESGEMRKLPVRPYVYWRSMAYEWEWQFAFFTSHNIKPHWVHANGSYGTLNRTTGEWNGSTGLIQRDEADYTTSGMAAFYERSQVASFTPGKDFLPMHYITRYPQKLSPTWNLLRLFTKGCNS